MPSGEMREMDTWQVQFTVGGQTYRESAHTAIYKEAQDYLRRRVGEIATGSGPAGPQGERLTVGDLLSDLMLDYETHNPRSVRFARTYVEGHLQPFFGAMRAIDVQTRTLKTYIKSRQEAGDAPATINRHLALLRRAYNLATQSTPPRIRTAPSFRGLFFAENNARQGFWTHEEYEKFRDALPMDEATLFTVAYYTGARFGELVKLRWEQVDLAAGLIRLRYTKNSEPRILPLGPEGSELRTLIQGRAELRERLCPGTEWLFYRSEVRASRGVAVMMIGRQVKSIRHQWAAAQEATGITHLFHDLRRTGVRNMRLAGVPESVAMRISGHKSRTVFERYNITDEADLSAAAEALSELLKKKGKK